MSVQTTTTGLYAKEDILLERNTGETDAEFAERYMAAEIIQAAMDWTPDIIERKSRTYLARVIYNKLTMEDPATKKKVPPAISKGKIHIYNEALRRWTPMTDEQCRVMIMNMDGALVPQGEGKEPSVLSINNDMDILSKFKALCDKRIDMGKDHEGAEWLSRPQKGIAFKDRYILPVLKEVASQEDPKKMVERYVLEVEDVTYRHHVQQGQGYPCQMPKPQRIPSNLDDKTWDATMAKVLDDIGAEHLKKYLWSVWPDDPDAPSKRRFLAQWLGIAMLGLSNDQRFMRALILKGTQGTGKSTFIKVAASLFPKGATSNVEPHLFQESDKLEALSSAKLNFVEELSKAPIRDDAKLRSVIDGSPQQVKIPYLKPFIVSPNCAHLYGTNRLPSIPGANPATLKRFVILELNRTFRDTEDQIMDIDKLIAKHEQSQLISWALTGAMDALELDGYKIPDSCQASLASWHRDGDSVGSWVEEELCDENGKLLEPPKLCEAPSAKEMFILYRDWCQQNSHTNVAWKEFKIRLVDQGVRIAKDSFLRACVTLNDEGQKHFQQMEQLGNV